MVSEAVLYREHLSQDDSSDTATVQFAKSETAQINEKLNADEIIMEAVNNE